MTDLVGYVELFTKEKEVNPEINGLVGRILRGTKPEDFETLTDVARNSIFI